MIVERVADYVVFISRFFLNIPHRCKVYPLTKFLYQRKNFTKKKEERKKKEEEMQEVEVIRKVLIEKVSKFVQIQNGGHKYYARLVTSVDGGKTFWYCGVGKDCKTLKDAREYKKANETGIDYSIRYHVQEDLQGGDFGMYRDFTVEQWRNQAIDWATMDDNEGLVESLNRLKHDEVLPFVAELWRLKFRKTRKDKKSINDDSYMEVNK